MSNPRIRRPVSEIVIIVVGWAFALFAGIIMALPLLPGSEGSRHSVIDSLGPPLVLLALPIALIMFTRGGDAMARRFWLGVMIGILLLVPYAVALILVGDSDHPLLWLGVQAVVYAAAIVLIRARVRAASRVVPPLATTVVIVGLCAGCLIVAVLAAIGDSASMSLALGIPGCLLALLLAGRSGPTQALIGGVLIGLISAVALVGVGLAVIDETEFFLAIPLALAVVVVLRLQLRPALGRTEPEPVGAQ